MGRQYNADSSPRHMLRTLVVDDHDAVRKAICQLLRSQSDFEVVCEVADGFEVRRTEELQPDVVVLDISMPNLNGIEAARHICRVAPGAEILFLTQHNSSQIVREALSTGARGYVLKTEAANELIDAVYAVGQHKQFVSSKVCP